LIHLSVDVKGQRLFVSALGNNTVEVIDIKVGKRVKDDQRPARTSRPFLYVPASDRLYVAMQRMEASGYLMEVRMPLSRPSISAMTPTTFDTILAASESM